jgi:hypothetical protein
MIHFRASNMYFLKNFTLHEIFGFIKKFGKMHLICTTHLKMTL